MAAEGIQEVKEKLALALRILVNEGVIENSGHPSFRLPGTEQVCILGHIHEHGGVLGKATAEDFVVVDLDGKVVEGKHEPVGEIGLHTEIYRARRDVAAIIHSHPPTVIALSIAGIRVLPVWLNWTNSSEAVPMFSSSRQIRSKADGQELAGVLGMRDAVVLKGHGAVTVGTSIEQACVVTLTLEKTAKLQFMAAQFGQPQPLSAQDLATYANKGRDSEESRELFWNLYGGRLDKGLSYHYLR
ncbi:MAG: class II aldolase/adducin family protein [Chloroflexi bacterium]|nr:class II aldolase/adducin family protein [Chloroflexota bacterium]